MKVLKDFTTNNRPKHARSRLWAKKEEIFELARQNFSTYQIVQYLQTQKIQTSQKNVNNFLRKHFKNKNKGDTNPTNYYNPAPARAHQSPAKAGVNLKEQIGAEANAEAENPNIIRGYGGVKIDTTHPLYIQLQKNKNKGNTDD